MNHNQLTNLKRNYKGQRKFPVKAEGYYVDIFADEWELGYKKKIYFKWVNELDAATYLDLKLTIANAAYRYAYSSLKSHVSILKTIVDYLDVHTFNAWWLTLEHYKKPTRNALHAFCQPNNGHRSATLSPLYDSIKNEHLRRNNNIAGVFDVTNGAYSEIEHDNLLEGLRIETLQALPLHDEGLTQKKFTRLRNVIASQLIVATIRRPSQLTKAKWCDVLPVGQEFKSHKEPDRYWQPITQHLFSDIEQLHFRTFRSKNGEFRFDAESRSHRLEPDLSRLLLHYFQVYERHLSNNLNINNIILSPDEIAELMRRLPILPDQSLFHSKYQSKSEVFMAISDTSEAYHMQPLNLTQNISYLFKAKLNVQSDRLPNTRIALANNRWRHTQLTQAVWMGFSPAQIASITGVTIEAILPYLDLKTQERVKIDQAYAGNHIIKRFDTISVKTLQKDKVFCVKSPFEEEIGYQLTPENCSSCKSKGGVPLGCYPCDNFRPLETANHQKYLDKAERKLKINSQSAHPATTKRLEKIIVYIKATIALCEERNTGKIGGKR